MTDNSGSACGTNTATFNVFVDASPVADAGPDADIYIGGAQDSFILDASHSQDPDGDALSHHWALSNGEEFDGEKARVEFSKPGTFTATLTTTDPHGLACGAASDSVKITTKLRPPSIQLSD